MKKSVFTIVALFSIAVLFSCNNNAPKVEDEALVGTESVKKDTSTEDAVSSAKEWLVLVDAGKYPESWDNTASIFQNAMTKEKWDETLNELLPSFGKVITREVIAAKYYSKLPGAPDGEYVVIQFQTSFENKSNSIETITPMKDNGKWKVSGYYIK